MMLPDVSVLICAFRREVPQHAVCRKWLDEVVLGAERFAISPLALAAVVRITTNTRTYAAPSSLESAFRYCEDLLGQPHCQVVEPASVIGTFSEDCASRRKPVGRASPTPGTRHSPSNGAANG